MQNQSRGFEGVMSLGSPGQGPTGGNMASRRQRKFLKFRNCVKF